MTAAWRFSFLVDQDNKLLVVRPIGSVPSADFADKVVSAYGSLEEPWRFNRIIDMRRLVGYIDDQDRGRIAKRWAEITTGVTYTAKVAMLAADRFEKLRLPEICRDFPNETICFFTNYNEAVGWLLATDGDDFLSKLGDAPVSRRHEHAISIG